VQLNIKSEARQFRLSIRLKTKLIQLGRVNEMDV